MQQIPSRKTPYPVPTLSHGLAGFASRHAPGFASGILQPPCAKILLIRTGSGWIEIDRHSTLTVENGSLIIIAAHTPHALGDTPGSPLTLNGICVDPSSALADPLLQQGWSALLAHGSTHAVYRLGRRAPAVARAMTGLLTAPAEDPIRTTGWFRLVLAEILAVRDAARGAHPIQDLLPWLETHAHLALSVDELADRCGLSYRGFTAAFRQATGMTVLQHLHRLRLADACQRLQAGEPIIHAAYAAGFNDLAHFHRVFKRNLGLTPGAWLHQHPGSA